MSLDTVYKGWFAVMVTALGMACTLGAGNPTEPFSETLTPPSNDVVDTSPVCPGATPVLCEATESYEGGCWSDGTDCTTVHANPTGEWAACSTDEVATIDSTDTLQCCPMTETLYCESDGDYSGGCHKAVLACDTLAACGDDWLICGSDQQVACGTDNTGGCCTVETPTWCPALDEQAGFCAGPDADCGQVLLCNDAQTVCNEGETIHCDATGSAQCCGNDTPTWCPPGSGGQSTFPGACMPANSSCGTLSANDSGTWFACKITDTIGTDVDGTTHCCGGDLPLWCPPSAEEGESTYPGDQCLAANVDCTSLTWDPNDLGWASCTIDAVTYDVDTAGTLVCCDAETPTLCPIGTGFGSYFDGSQCIAKDGDCASLYWTGDTWTYCSVSDGSYGLTLGEVTDYALQCCGGDTPTYCEPGDGNASFDGSQCFPANANCDSLFKDGAGQWSSCPNGVHYAISNAGANDAQLVCCSAGESAHMTQENTVLCCGGNTPKFCPLSSGIGDNFDGSLCLPADADCGSLHKSTGNPWAWCSTSVNWALTPDGSVQCCESPSETAHKGADGAVVCCGQNPVPALSFQGTKWCAPSEIWDGDAAYQFGIDYWNSTPGCDAICSSNIQCQYVGKDPTDGSETQLFAKCAHGVNSCKQCVLPQEDLSPGPQVQGATKVFATEYGGSCWHDMQPDCSKLMLCGGTVQPCLGDKPCYCWNGEVKALP